jgi:hypothetical protein
MESYEIFQAEFVEGGWVLSCKTMEGFSSVNRGSKEGYLSLSDDFRV